VGDVFERVRVEDEEVRALARSDGGLDRRETLFMGRLLPWPPKVE
jgi:hypothetical protein